MSEEQSLEATSLNRD